MPVYTQNILAWTPGTTEWIVILIVALLLFGRRLPELARGLGKSLTEFKKGLNEAKDTKDEITSDLRKTTDDIVNQAKDASGFKDINKP
jgi:sec-independent protein translocase protein TatA